MAKPDVDESLNPWTTTSSRPVYENPWISVEHNEVVDPSGRPGIYGVVRPRNWALGVVPVFENGDTLFVGQYRYSLDEYSWEMPEGGGLREVDPLASIQRELVEETGYRATHWLPLLRLALSNSITDETAFTWVAWELTPGPSAPESTEDLRIWRLPFREALAMIDAGAISDVLTVAALQCVELRRLRGQLPPELTAALTRGA